MTQTLDGPLRVASDKPEHPPIFPSNYETCGQGPDWCQCQPGLFDEASA